MAEIFIIEGGRPIHGEIEVRGSKNAASKMMIASLLTNEECVIKNVPLSAEIDITKELCQNIGSTIECRDDHTCLIQTSEIKNPILPELSRRNRIPILALGPLVHRAGVAEVPIVGGDYLGHRPVNFHLDALAQMGVRIERRESSYYAEAEHPHGAAIIFPYPSVGATENVMLTAVLAEGTTTIDNAALEPEVVNLIEMLQSMGARIQFDCERRKISIEGVRKLQGTTVTVMPDRNEIVSFAAAALATRGSVLIPGIDVSYLSAFLEKLRILGARIEKKSSGIQFTSAGAYNPVAIETSPHPGFMTDWQQPFSILLTAAHGESIIHETVYEDRFGYTKDLKRMGANITLSDECWGTPCRFFGKTFNHSARIAGPTPLHGEHILMTDIRAGMAHLIAALAAEGRSTISGIEHIDRGYERIDARLQALGANIKRISKPESLISKQIQNPNLESVL